MQSISWASLGYLSLLWSMLALACAVVTQIVKTPIKIVWKRRTGMSLRGDQLALYSWTIRTITIVAGIAGAQMPNVWPEFVSTAWATMLGGTAGCMSVGVYHAVKKALPKAIALLPEMLKKRLGG